MSNVSQITRSGPESDNPKGPTFRRSRKGSEELVTRRMDLTSDQRQVLLYANGKRSIDELTSRVESIQSNPELLFEMETAGLIEMFDPDLNDVADSNNQAERARRVSNDSESQAPAPRDELAKIKRDIEAELYELLGRDASDAVDKLQQIETADGLAAVLPKLEQLAKLSGGIKAGERFASKFGRWMK